MCLCVCEIQQIVFDSQLLALMPMHHHFYCINNSKLLPTIDINFPLLSLCASVDCGVPVAALKLLPTFLWVLVIKDHSEN